MAALSSLRSRVSEDGEFIHERHRSWIERKGSVVVAIDIGATFSGYAMSFSRDKFTIHATCSVDPFRPAMGSRIQKKVPTVLLLKPDLTFHSFGQEALTHYYRELNEEEQIKWHFFERFNMSLVGDICSESILLINLRRIFGDRLRFRRRMGKCSPRGPSSLACCATFAIRPSKSAIRFRSSS